jgi:hypothetical protein
MSKFDHFYLYDNGNLSDITEIQRFLAVSKDLSHILLRLATTVKLYFSQFFQKVANNKSFVFNSYIFPLTVLTTYSD